jgi:hypothetical protein
MKPRHTPLILCTAVLVFFTSSCSDGLDCPAVAHRTFQFDIRAPSGTNLTHTAHYVVRRLEGVPAVAVDSVQGEEGAASFAFQDQPGDYRITISHQGYVSQERVVTVDPSGLEGCNSRVEVQHVSVTLVPQGE